jgi:dipeptidyl aminopeptidase/acylaminoacyl peptidase
MNNTVLGTEALTATELCSMKLIRSSESEGSVIIPASISVSPDGKSALISAIKMTMNSANSIYASGEIYSVDTDTGRFRMLGYGLFPKWSPDGTKILYSGNDEDMMAYGDAETGESQAFNTNLYIRDENGNATSITNTTQSEYMPAWSPDGSKIAYSSTSFGFEHIYVMNADGSNSSRLTNKTLDPAEWSIWSPDSSKIAFSSNSTGNGDIYLMSSNGTNITRITDSDEVEVPQAWSKDGKKILYSSGSNLCLMNPDGSGKEIIVKASMSTLADFSPQDNVIYYTDSSGSGESILVKLFKLEIDGWQ